MLAFSRSLVARRWTLPLVATWGKLAAVAFGFLGFSRHAFDSPPVPLLTPIGSWYDCLLSFEAWGIALLALAAISYLLRIRSERRRGLSPRMRGVFWTCVGGVEAVGVAAWGFVVWLYTAPYSIPAR